MFGPNLPRLYPIFLLSHFSRIAVAEDAAKEAAAGRQATVRALRDELAEARAATAAAEQRAVQVQGDADASRAALREAVDALAAAKAEHLRKVAEVAGAAEKRMVLRVQEEEARMHSRCKASYTSSEQARGVTTRREQCIAGAR